MTNRVDVVVVGGVVRGRPVARAPCHVFAVNDPVLVVGVAVVVGGLAEAEAALVELRVALLAWDNRKDASAQRRGKPASAPRWRWGVRHELLAPTANRRGGVAAAVEACA